VQVHLPPAPRPPDPLPQRLAGRLLVVLRLHGRDRVPQEVKKTPLIRRTPLRARKPWHQWVRPEEDKVSPELAAYIFDRDVICLQFRYEPDHQCRERFLGLAHKPDDRRYLRIAHVKADARTGKRAEPDKYHLVAECDEANNKWSSANRQTERDYLALVEPV
jgi:hypothetical protein